jgi:endoglucanase
MKLCCAASFAVASVFAAQPVTTIKLNQAGYLPNSPKMAAVAANSAAASFSVRRADTGAAAYSGDLSTPVLDADSGDRVRAADFSKLTAPGRYYLDVPAVGRSWEFEIGPQVYDRVFYLAMRSYYGQRCNTTVDLGPQFPGFRRDACHLDGAYHTSSGKSGGKKPSGGWHDAGDYGRYVVNSGITSGTLLWAWELYGDRLRSVKLDIPESGNGVPDILNEIRWNLEWMLSMQDTDGGVWHKQTSDRFAPFVMPEKDPLTSYVIGTGARPYKSSCATGDFAAVMAIASRAFQRFDAKFADRSLKAARDAWAWLEMNPDVLFRNPPGVATGEYGDRNCGDERLWAAAELWRSTSDDVHNRYFLDNYGEFRPSIRPDGPPAWPNVAALGLCTYALAGGGDASAAATIRDDIQKSARQIVERSVKHPYRISLTAKDYVWGSNSIAANYGMQLLVAHALQPDRRYVECALDNLHYLLGRNTFSLSWVTQVGANPFRHPHHRPSGADNNAEPWPGLLSGGPNAHRQDPAMKKLPELPPARMYLDEQESYATNEVAINWNAPLVFLLAGVMR